MRKATRRRGALAAAAAIAFLPNWAAAEVINRGEEGKPLHEARPAPKSIFPDEHIIVAVNGHRTFRKDGLPKFPS